MGHETGDRKLEMGNKKHETELGFRRLDVWRKADELAHEVYKATAVFPRDEIFGLTSQMRRAAVSVPANIVEGYAYYSNKEKTRFYRIANGSLAELEYYIHFVYEKLKYIDEANYKALVELRTDTGKMLNGLIKKTGERS